MYRRRNGGEGGSEGRGKECSEGEGSDTYTNTTDKLAFIICRHPNRHWRQEKEGKE